GRPGGGRGIVVVVADVGATGGDESRHAAKGAPAQALARNLGEEALDEIQPGRPGRGEVEMKPRVVREPRLHRGMLVCAVIVENEMDVPAARRLPSGRVQEGDELSVRVAGLTAIDQ